MGSNSIAPEWIAAPARALATSYDKIQNSSKMSRIRQNYREETEALVNQQINIQLTASYAYQAMAAHFDRDDEAGLGYSKFVSQAVSRPSNMAWDSPLAAFQEALEQEKTVNESLLSTHRMADGDPHLCDLLEDKFLGGQVDTIREVSTWITKLKRVGAGLGYHIIDTEVTA